MGTLALTVQLLALSVLSALFCCGEACAWVPPAAGPREGGAPLARPGRRAAVCLGGGAAALLVRRGRAQRPGALRGGSASMAVIDSAVHVWKKDPAFPWAKEAAANPPAKDASAEVRCCVRTSHGCAHGPAEACRARAQELLELMDASGVDKAGISLPERLPAHARFSSSAPLYALCAPCPPRLLRMHARAACTRTRAPPQT